MNERPYFARAKLAQDIAKQMLRPSLLGGAQPGLFLAAPRRTGKSTFLRRDLVPALESMGALVLYVDLWTDQDSPPADLIAGAIARSLAEHQGVVARVAKSMGLEKVKIRGLEFSIDKVGKAAGATLAEALRELHEVAGKSIVLIIDEAQHVVRVDQKMAVMAALKAARDALNSQHDNLYLVMSGSDRDKLLRLVHGNGAPFYGADINPLPTLGKDYVAYAAGELARVYPALVIQNDRLAEIFDKYDHRPEFFEEDIARALSPMAGPLEGFMDRLAHLADQRQLNRDEEYASTFDDLTSIQKAIISELAQDSRDAPRLFTNNALARYSFATKKKIRAGQARSAIEQMRDRDPPLVWKSGHGDYAFEDTGFLRWFRAKRGAWPQSR